MPMVLKYPMPLAVKLVVDAPPFIEKSPEVIVEEARERKPFVNVVRPVTESAPANVLVAVVEVATKYGAEIEVPAEMMAGVIVPETDRSPVTVVAPRFVVPPVRLVKLPSFAETLTPLSKMLLRKSPFLTIRLERSSILFTI